MPRTIQRRSDEEMEKLLLEKLQKLQDRIAKKHFELYSKIGYLLCKMAEYDVTTLTAEQKEAIVNKTDEGKTLIEEIALNIK